MEIEQYISTLSQTEQQAISQFRKVILENDKAVSESFGKFMSNPNAISYNEQGVFKYGLTVAKNYISFHSLVMYSKPQLMDELKSKLPKAKFQKGCINFKSLDEFPESILVDHMQISSKIDFSPVINRYLKKK
ncbi:DUF1801 domain-containing protein [Sphingobacterium sp. ML3W]|uniref:DUF1801 domain-containing protein n=1 Tax=Sphingobacterium TaxID=28453 RepID=UPI001CC15548|nr:MULTISPECIES: DUF1801 domain-containing protein [unclassified Sphingobacterium]WFA80248.1 DUF1801 domain-containing protein [Sphingobacterium sp. ML3W]